MFRTMKQQATQQKNSVHNQLQKVKSKYHKDILSVKETANNDFIIKLKPETHNDYNGFRSRPDLKIATAIANVLKDSELKPSEYRVLVKKGNESGLLVETRPFQDRPHQEVL